MTMKTGQGLVDYCESRLGTPYFYGSKITDGVLTRKFMDTMHAMYPTVVTTAYITKAIQKAQVGRVNVDCSGLIAGYRNKNIGSAQLYSTAKKRMPISGVKNFAPGVVLWYKGHVAVNIDGVYCYEARGINYGTVKSKIEGRGFVYGLTFDDLDYTYSSSVTGTSKAVNPYKEPVNTVTSAKQAKARKVGVYLSSGDGVKWIQYELNESGYDLKIDGICGALTVKAISDFQRSCKITVDGLAGKITRTKLKNV